MAKVRFLISHFTQYDHADLRSTGFNRMAGGVFAHLWDDTGIKMWHFGRDEIPCDLLDQTPEPDSWGTPVAAFTLSGCEVKDAFKDHGLIIDTTLCGMSRSTKRRMSSLINCLLLGDWAGNAFASSGCPGTCADAVKNPDNFKCEWLIRFNVVDFFLTVNYSREMGHQLHCNLSAPIDSRSIHWSGPIITSLYHRHNIRRKHSHYCTGFQWVLLSSQLLYLILLLSSGATSVALKYNFNISS